MTPYVVDSSVVVKWYVAESLTALALRVRGGPAPLHAPDFLHVEVGNILWKKRRQGALARPVADAILADLPGLAILTRHPTAPLVAPAFDLADRGGRTVYDCVYLALAVQLGGQVVTADERHVNALAGTPWAGHMIKLQDVP
jgi:predicted nucleic acid-binding protein